MTYNQLIELLEEKNEHCAVLLKHIKKDITGIALKFTRNLFTIFDDDVMIIWQDGKHTNFYNNKKHGILDNDEVEVLNWNLWDTEKP
jgi:hypothetical protein